MAFTVFTIFGKFQPITSQDFYRKYQKRHLVVLSNLKFIPVLSAERAGWIYTSSLENTDKYFDHFKKVSL